MMRVEAHLIGGFPGAGKTTLLRALLSQRSPAEHWALLLNASGGIDTNSGITVHSINGGCACCSARAPFRAALVQLLRSARPHRLLIELSGAGDPAGILAVISEADIAPAITLRSTLCVVQPRHLANADIVANEIFRTQLHHADHVVLAAAPATQTADAMNALSRLGVGHAAVTLIDDAGPALLSAGAGNYSNDNSRRISS